MRHITIVFLVFLMASCGQDANEQIVPLGPSRSCAQISGNEGLLWDLHNAVARADLPGGVPPTVSNVGGTYSNPVHPLLGFTYPVGYTPATIPGAGTVGVVLTRNDNAVLWKYLQSSVPGFLPARTLRDQEITATKNFYGIPVNANIAAECFNEQSAPVAIGIEQSISSIFFRVGEITTMVIAMTTNTSSLNTTFTSVRKVSAPTAEFDRLALETFLAIDFQLLIRNPDSILDSDLDGVEDSRDREPFNPNVQ